MSSGLYSGQPGLSLGTGLYRTVSGLWSGASGLAMAFGGAGMPLSLNFLTMTAYTLDPRITFSRGSQAMVTDETGKLTYAPNNLLTNSESFAAASWFKLRTTVTSNTVAAPDGTSTADTIGTTTGTSAGEQAVRVSATISTPSVFSVYVKKSNWRYVGVRIFNYSIFDLDTATWTLTGAGETVSAQNIGNGWYRLSTSTTSTGTGNVGVSLHETGTATVWTTPINGTEVYAWGAQLEQVTYQTTPGTYNSTTPKNLLGYTQEFDNAAWTKSNAFAYPFDPETATQGPELVTNGNFSSEADWVLGPGVSISSGLLVFTGSSGNTTQDAVAVSARNKFISVTYTITSRTSGSIAVFVQQTSPSIITNFTTFRAASGTYTEFLFVPPNSMYFGFNTADFVGTIDNISVKEVIGGLITAPDGSLTADKLVENTANSTHIISTPITASSSIYTYSIYVKAAERNIIRMRDSLNNVDGYFDLTNVTSPSGNAIKRTITAVGNGWFRCSMTSAAAIANPEFGVRLATAVGTDSYTGDGTSGIYIWGAQLSNSASVDPYVYNPVAAPSSTAYYGPRFDYDPVTLAPRGLLIEEQRTNLLQNSTGFGSNWTSGGGSTVTVTANASLAPDGGTTATQITLASGSSNIRYINAPVTVTPGTAYTFSVFLKTVSGAIFQAVILYGATGSARGWLNTSTGAITGLTSSNYTNASMVATSFGNGWWRVALTATVVTDTAVQVDTEQASVSGGYAAAIGDSCLFWGAQLEAGSFATSYIPTVASTVTRSADVALMQGANFSNWYNQSQGSFVAWFAPYVSGSYTVASATDGSFNNRIQLPANSAVQFLVGTGGSIQALIDAGTINAGAINKIAGAYLINDFAVSTNNSVAATDTAGTVPTVSRFDIGNLSGLGEFLNGHIRSISYYNTRLPNQQLQALTS